MTKTEAQFAALILVVPFGFLIITVLLVALGVRWIILSLLCVVFGMAGVRSQRRTTPTC